jgi:hypothetical protein
MYDWVNTEDDYYDLSDMDWDAARVPLRGNVRRGGVAEHRLERIFRRRGYNLEQQVPVVFLNRQGIPRSGRIDLVPVSRTGGKPAPYAFESKFVDLARYRLPSGGLDIGRLRSLVTAHVNQALRYQQGLGAVNQMRQQQGLSALPNRLRIIYQVPQTTSPQRVTRDEASVFQRLALSVARPRGIAVTVFMPGSRASQAFSS